MSLLGYYILGGQVVCDQSIVNEILGCEAIQVKLLIYILFSLILCG